MIPDELRQMENISEEFIEIYQSLASKEEKE